MLTVRERGQRKFTFLCGGDGKGSNMGYVSIKARLPLPLELAPVSLRFVKILNIQFKLTS